MLYHLVMHAERVETQLTAACRLHDIICGPPAARRVTFQADEA
jgi:hypothetical protein